MSPGRASMALERACAEVSDFGTNLDECLCISPTLRLLVGTLEAFVMQMVWAVTRCYLALSMVNSHMCGAERTLVKFSSGRLDSFRTR